MSATEFKYKISTEVELTSLAQLDQKLQAQIVSAKATGKEYTELEKQLAAVQARMAELGNTHEGAARAATGLTKAAEGTTAAVRVECANIGRLQDELKNANHGAKALTAGKQAMAQVMGGNLLGAGRSLITMFRSLTTAMATNPVGLLMVAFSGLAQLLLVLRNRLQSAKEKAEELNKANFDELKSKLGESTKQLEEFDKLRLDTLNAGIAKLIEQQREYQRELDRSREKQLRLIDEDYADKVADLNLKKEQELAKAKTPEERERINLKYRGEETKLRHARDRDKADTEVTAARAKITANEREQEALQQGTDKAEQAWQKTANEKVKQSQRIERLSYTNKDGERQRAVSDQQAELNELRSLEKKKGLTSDERRRRKELEGRRAGNQSAVLTRNETYNKVLDAINEKKSHDQQDDDILAAVANLVAAQKAEEANRKSLVDINSKNKPAIEQKKKEHEDLTDKLNSAKKQRTRLDVTEKSDDQSQQNAESDLAKKEAEQKAEKQKEYAEKVRQETLRKLKNEREELLLKTPSADTSKLDKEIIDAGLAPDATTEQRRAAGLEKQKIDAKQKRDAALKNLRDAADRSNPNDFNVPLDKRDVGESTADYQARQKQNAQLNQKLGRFNAAAEAMADGIDNGELEEATQLMQEIGTSLPTKLRELVEAIRLANQAIKDVKTSL